MKVVENDELSNALGVIADSGLYAVGGVDRYDHADITKIAEHPRIQEMLLRYASGPCAAHYQHGAGAWHGLSAHHEWAETVVIYAAGRPVWVITPDPANRRRATIRHTTPEEYLGKSVAA